MKAEAQRIAIAEHCGAIWIDDGMGNPMLVTGKLETDLVLAVDAGDKGMMILGLPDYPNDLNAMHEAEKLLTESEFSRYVLKLKLILGASFKSDYREEYAVIATAAQRAEAFLRTIGKWEEST